MIFSDFDTMVFSRPVELCAEYTGSMYFLFYIFAVQQSVPSQPIARSSVARCEHTNATVNIVANVCWARQSSPTGCMLQENYGSTVRLPEAMIASVLTRFLTALLCSWCTVVHTRCVLGSHLKNRSAALFLRIP